MTIDEVLKRIKALRDCTNCEIKGIHRNCDECITGYECGTLGEIRDTFNLIIEHLERLTKK